MSITRQGQKNNDLLKGYIKYCVTDLDIDLGPLVINDDDSISERPEEERTSLPMILYTVYGLLFHMGILLKSKHHYFLSEVLV